MVTGTQRERLGNAIYGQYGQDFTSQDGVAFMVVALTGRHLRDLANITGTTEAVATLAETLHADFADEGDRYRHRDALTGLFWPWFANHRADQISALLSTTSVLWERYRTFAQTAADPCVTDNPLFTGVHQPHIGDYLAAGSPMSIDGAHSAAVAAPTLGEDTLGVLTERLAMSPQDVHRLCESGVVATA
jgi:2-methylfumaryl-CoA isomerase